MIMHEISFQAVPYLPRLFSVITLLLLTLLVAKLVKSETQRVARSNKKDSLARILLLKLSNIAFWIVVLLFLPNIFRAAGLDAVWLRQVQLHTGQIFSNWPIWILISLIIAGISYIFLNIQRLFIQHKRSPGTSPEKY
jgi:hypothetical protein